MTTSVESAQRCVNLTFHGIGEPVRPLAPGEEDYWITVAQWISLLDQVKLEPDIRLSFDDGNDSDLRYGLPALQERGLHATFFVVAGRLGKPGFLDADDVRALSAAGMTIGCHGMHHRRWRKLDDRELRDEVFVAKGILEDIVGRPVTHAACPFGSYGRRVLRSLRHYGYQRVFTSDCGVARSDSWLQVRNSIHPWVGKGVVDQIVAPRTARRAFAREAKLAVKRWR